MSKVRKALRPLFTLAAFFLATLAQAQTPFAPAMPLFFEKNEGQFDRRADFLARLPNATLYLTGADAVLVHRTDGKDEASALRLHWVGAGSATALVGEAEMAAKTNYFTGNDQSRWRTGVTNFQRVRQSELYPGVDIVYYGHEQQLEYDLTVQPGVSPADIQLRTQGADSVVLDKATGDLVIADAVESPLRLLKPIAYQTGENQQKIPISARYVLSAHNTVSFELGDYDHSRPLIIDPQVVYSTVFGGTQTTTGSSSTNVYAGMTVDSRGFVYLAGVTGGFNLPTTTGAWQTTCDATAAGCANFFVAKFDPTQSGNASLIYVTYIGGATNDTASYSNTFTYKNPGNNLAVDTNGDAYIVGHVFAADNSANPAYGNGQTNFPTTSNAFAPACTSAPGDACPLGFLTEINPAGSQLLYSTFLEPTVIASPVAGMEFPSMVAVDGNQIAYVAGYSGVTSNFLAAYNTTLSGVASQVYAVGFYFNATALAVDPAGNAYLGGTATYLGSTISEALADPTYDTQTFILTGAETSTPSNVFPGVLIAFNPAGQNTYATLFGTATGDIVSGVSADPNGIAYVVGTGTNITQVNGLPSGSGTGTLRAFVAEVDTAQTGTNSLLYSTYINADYLEMGSQGLAISGNGSGLFAFSGQSPGQSVNGSRYFTYPLVNPLIEPTLLPTGPENSFVGIIDPSKIGPNALISLSFVDGASQAYSLFFAPGVGAPPSTYTLYVAGSATTTNAGSPFLGVPASYLTTLTPSSGSEPLFFYKIAVGPIDSLSLSPTSLYFQSNVVGSTTPPLSFTVTNTSASSVNINGVTASSQFNETDDCTGTLGVGQSCTVQVTFGPPALAASNASPSTGTVSINVPGTGAPLSEYVWGYGVDTTRGTGFFSPQSIAFGTQPTGTTSAPVSVTLTNTSAFVELGTPSSINVGQFPLGFTLVGSNCSELAVSKSCTFSVAFSPTTTTNTYNGGNNYSGTLYSAGLNTMTLTGTAGPPAPLATLSATMLNFPNTLKGSQSLSQSVTLTNTGSATMTGISVGGTAGANPSSYNVGGSCLTTSSLIVGANCTMTVAFAPQATGILTASVTITDSATPSTQSVSFTGTGTSSSQTITFGALNNVTYGAAPFTVGATSSSHLTVSFVSTTSAVCTVAGTKVTIVGGGTCTIVAWQAGNATFAAAAVMRSFTVNPASQTINFVKLTNRTFGSSPLPVSATASSGLGVVFASNSPAVCTLSGVNIMLVATGACSTTASQGGNSNYNAAPSVTQTFMVSKDTQTIDFAPLSNRDLGSGSFALSATTTAALTVAFASDTKPVCTVSGVTVTLVAGGTCTIVASQSGNADFDAAPPLIRSFSILKTQTITFNPLINRTLGSGTFALTAKASSNLTVAYASNSLSFCTVSGVTFKLISQGLCSITASQAGNSAYAPAPLVTQTFTIIEPQTITFAALTNQALVTGSFALTATASSNLTVIFASNTDPVCTVSGVTVTFVKTGICSITASQGGNSTFAAASSVTRTFSILTAQFITFGRVNPVSVSTPPFALIATSSSGLTVTFVSNSPSFCTVSSGKIKLIAAGTCSVTANQAGNSTYAPATGVTRMFTILQTQTITFAPLTNRTVFSGFFTLSATASSGLAVAFASNGDTVCSVSATYVLLLSTGTCSITASQSGDGTYAPAPSVTRTFTVIF